MSKIAVLIGNTYIHWVSVIVVAAALTAIFIFLASYRKSGGNLNAAALFIPLALVLSVLFSRIVHWYCRFELYGGLISAITDFTGGGYALFGVFIGTMLSAIIVSVIKLEKNALLLFDCMAPAAAFGIALGRLASFFDSSDRGMVIESIKSLPLVSAVNNPVTGAPEYRFATFLFQAIFCALLGFWLISMLKVQRKRGDVGSGEVFLFFLSAYGAGQIVLDSTRYDSLFLRSNGFISIVQIAGAVCVVLVLFYYAIELWRYRGFKATHVLFIILSLALIGGAGFMEYYVQRHGDRAIFSYSVMTACLIGLNLITLNLQRKVRPQAE